jgi:flagellar basal body P-ring protein FlgI
MKKGNQLRRGEPEVTTQPAKHEIKKEWTVEMVRELVYETQGYAMEHLKNAAWLLNRLGIPPCHLITILQEMEEDGELDSCSQCSPNGEST